MTTKKATTAKAADSAQDLMKDAIKLYEEALKNGIQLQEESLELWKDMLKQVGTPDELREKIEKMTGGVFPETRQKMEDILKVFQDNTEQSMTLFNKAMNVYQSTSFEEGQARVQDLMESSLGAMRTNVQTVLDTNSKMMASWTDFVEKTTSKTF
jgi:hypothetical protein